MAPSSGRFFQVDPCPDTVSKPGGGNRKLVMMHKNGFERHCCGCNGGQYLLQLCSEDSFSSTVCGACPNGGNQGLFVHDRSECIPPSTVEAPNSTTSLAKFNQNASSLPTVQTWTNLFGNQSTPDYAHPGLATKEIIGAASLVFCGVLFLLLIGLKVYQVVMRKAKNKKMVEALPSYTQQVDFIQDFIEHDLGKVPNLQVDPNYVTQLGRNFLLGGTELCDLRTTYQGSTPAYLLAVCKEIRLKMSSDEAWIVKLLAFLEETGNRLLAEELDNQLKSQFPNYKSHLSADVIVAPKTDEQSQLLQERSEIRHSRLEGIFYSEETISF